MKIDIQRTDENVIIKLPTNSLPEDIEVALSYLRYLQLGAKSAITQKDVDAMVNDSKGQWWLTNKKRFEKQSGFEGLI